MNNAYPLKQVDKLLDTPELLMGTTGNAALELHTDLFLEVHEVIATGITNLKAYPGQYRDSETGLSYNCYRDFDPSLGRYIQSDPIGLGGGLNTYGYVGGNSVNAIDPFGLLEWTSQQIQGPGALVPGIDFQTMPNMTRPVKPNALG